MHFKHNLWFWINLILEKRLSYAIHPQLIKECQMKKRQYSYVLVFYFYFYFFYTITLHQYVNWNMWIKKNLSRQFFFYLFIIYFYGLASVNLNSEAKLQWIVSEGSISKFFFKKKGKRGKVIVCKEVCKR